MVLEFEKHFGPADLGKRLRRTKGGSDDFSGKRFSGQTDFLYAHLHSYIPLLSTLATLAYSNKSS